MVVEVSLRQKDLMCQVIDTGPGFSDPNNSIMLFASKSLYSMDSTGMGLSTCLQQLMEIGGSMTITNELVGGARELS